MDLPERIVLARTTAGFDVAAHFADAIKVRPQTLWRYENARLKPSIDVLSRIATATGRTMEWFMAENAA